MKAYLTIFMLLFSSLHLEAASPLALESLLRFCKEFAGYPAVSPSIPKAIEMGKRDFKSVIWDISEDGRNTRIQLEVSQRTDGLRISVQQLLGGATGWNQEFVVQVNQKEKLNPLVLWQLLGNNLPQGHLLMTVHRYSIATRIWNETQKAFPELVRRQEYPDLDYFVKYGYMPTR